jgi:hypothetical protein
VNPINISSPPMEIVIFAKSLRKSGVTFAAKMFAESAAPNYFLFAKTMARTKMTKTVV